MIKPCLIPIVEKGEGTFSEGTGVQGNKYSIIYNKRTDCVHIMQETNCCMHWDNGCMYWNNGAFRRS